MKIQRLITSLIMFALFSTTTFAQTDLGIAQYTDTGELRYPDNLVEWIQTGASLGSEYNETPFDPAEPGTIGVVQMEPAAYRYFMANKTYADGTMFLLSFYRAESKSEPQLPGFVQGPLQSQEIHVLDKSRFGDGHGFFMFPTKQQQTSTRIPEANNLCTACHTEHGAFDGTFVQFYPAMREHLGLSE
ncbi:MAG: cytochrome P460 family protein [Pseudomonadota bacterium]